MKRLLVLLMTGTLCFSMVPGSAMAAEIEETSEQSDSLGAVNEVSDPALQIAEDDNENDDGDDVDLMAEESAAPDDVVDTDDTVDHELNTSAIDSANSIMDSVSEETEMAADAIDNEFQAWASESELQEQNCDVYVEPNVEATLHVEAKANDMNGITYQWYKWSEEPINENGEFDWEVIADAEDDSYTFATDKQQKYACEVTDRYESVIRIEYNIYIESTEIDAPLAVSNAMNVSEEAGAYHENDTASDDTMSEIDTYLNAWPEGADTNEDSIDIVFQAGQPVDLQVNVEAGDTSGIAYNWSSSYGDDLREVSGAQLSVTPQGNGYYHCEVSDQYGNCEDVWFYLTYDNGFQARAEGGEEIDPQSAYLYVPYGENVTLNVLAEADDTSKITYTWYGEISDYTLTEENVPSYTTAVESNEVYRCNVEDGYGNEEWIYFYVSVENNLKAWPEGAASEDDNSIDILYEPGDSLELKVNVTAGDMDGITYSWSSSYDENLDDVTEASFAAVPDGQGFYCCTVTDRYGNEVYVYFYITYDNGFSAVAENGDTEEPQNAYISAVYGEEVTLNVLAKANDDSNLTYTWYGELSDELLSEENTPSYVVTATQNDVYRCFVDDGYGNQAWIRFFISTCNHDLVKTVAKDATCTSDGNVEYYTCNICGKTFRDESCKNEIAIEETIVPAIAHTLVEKRLEFGNDVYYKCNVCGHSFGDSKGVNEIAEPGWVKSGENWKWRNIDQSFAKNKWIKSAGEWYYMSADGYMLTNSWAKDDIGWCWMGSDGKMTKCQWIKLNGEWYYLKDDGHMAAGEWAQDSNGWCWMDENGKVTKSKWIQDNGEWYYLKANGYMAANEWAQDGTGWCWMDANGMIAEYAGWTEILDELYYFNDSHYRVESSWMKDEAGTRWLNGEGKAVKSDWVKVDSDWYYIDSNGCRAESTWVKDSTGWCWLQADGRMLTNGWAKDSKGWCWIASNGYMLEGTKWIKVDGIWYHITKGYRDQNKWMQDSKGWCYLGSDGKMVTNGWAKDSKGWCWMGSDGYWVKSKWIKDEGEWYYLNASGYRAQNAWAKDGTGWCYMGPDGKMVKNVWKKDSKGWCYLGSDGYMVTNDWAKDSKGWCWIGSDGYMVEKTQWVKYDGDWYHITNGYRDVNKWMKDSKGWCWIGSDGYMVEKTMVIEYEGETYGIRNGYKVISGSIVIGGTTYTFDEDGKLVS